MSTTTLTAETIFGTRPEGAQSPDGSHVWATRTFEDGTWTFTTYKGWLVTGTTTTTCQHMAGVLTDHVRGWK
jgi:hypothetical protein